MSAATGAPGPDFSYLQKHFADLLLRKLWSPHSTATEREEIFSNLLRFPLRVDPGMPPVVGVGISEWSRVGGTTLEFLSTVENEALDIDKLLSSQSLGGIPFHVTKTGRLLASQRPAQGGESIGHHNGDTGTFGCLVKDDVRRQYILSCNHVLAALNKGKRGQDEIWVPGQKDGGGPHDRIGVLDAYKDIALGGQTSNLIDAALCRPDSPNDVLPGTRHCGHLRGHQDNPPFHIAVRKEGRKTGVTHGALRIKNLSLLVTYETGDKALFDGQLGIIGTQSSYFAKQGDSGAVVIDEENKAIGLLFCVSERVDIAYANPIKAIREEFGVSLI